MQSYNMDTYPSRIPIGGQPLHWREDLSDAFTDRELPHEREAPGRPCTPTPVDDLLVQVLPLST